MAIEWEDDNQDIYVEEFLEMVPRVIELQEGDNVEEVILNQLRGFPGFELMMSNEMKSVFEPLIAQIMFDQNAAKLSALPESDWIH